MPSSPASKHVLPISVQARTGDLYRTETDGVEPCRKVWIGLQKKKNPHHLFKGIGEDILSLIPVHSPDSLLCFCCCCLVGYFCFPIFRFGDVSLQESINQENFELVQEYYSIFTEKMPPDCKYMCYRKTNNCSLIYCLKKGWRQGP